MMVFRRQLVRAGGYSEVFAGDAACIVGDQGQANPVVADVDIRMVVGLFGDHGHLADECYGVREGFEGEGSHQFTGFDAPIGTLAQVGSNFCMRKYGHVRSGEDG